MLSRLRSHNAGDTIVEVLIAMAVASAVIGSSYLVVNRTMANTRQAQEHTEALEIANNQIESIVTLASNPGASDLTDQNPRFNCVSKDTGSLTPQPQLNFPSNDSSKYVADCLVGTSVQYKVAFEYVTTGLTAQQRYYKVYITWPSVTGNGSDQVTMLYRAYQP